MTYNMMMLMQDQDMQDNIETQIKVGAYYELTIVFICGNKILKYFINN